MPDADNLTPAQKRALDWLPSDGSWRGNPRLLLMSLRSIANHHSTWVDQASFPRSDGSFSRHWRLTPAGIEAKKGLTDGR